MTEPTGRRERKKAQTRKALADAALALFLERGYDDVGVREVAEAADVSVTTLFKYFPSKEALVFDIDQEVEAALVAAVRDRAPGQPVLGALREHILHRVTVVAGYPHAPAFTRMIENTPALREYARRMWLRHETALAQAIAAELDAPEGDVACAALARFALEAVELAHRHPDPTEAVEVIFTMLERGWAATSPDA
ncbi:TetR/AcrR family transcriptional regulator [Streptoalloteichus hindustanus]|uniref:Transcriptional regulator, TetR family n=1 Tax=Streptoalloteichus hindustanus TaxID=2017 RepID=A0A1M5DCY0_STRHI|nr:TetR/AcrR family transcriptional regulator [Streptoalloteichus hindustanus]SHF64800.1 transcriptional regulator, TetR family [Streptoalloteichus hindustanus]